MSASIATNRQPWPLGLLVVGPRIGCHSLGPSTTFAPRHRGMPRRLPLPFRRLAHRRRRSSFELDSHLKKGVKPKLLIPKSNYSAEWKFARQNIASNQIVCAALFNQFRTWFLLISLLL